MTGFLTHPEPDVHHRGDALGRSYTPDRCAEAIMRRMAVVDPRLMIDPRVFEPCVGGGAFVRAARRVMSRPTVVGADVDEGAPGRGDCDEFWLGDSAAPQPWLDYRQPRRSLFDLAITNPPFGKEVGQALTLRIVTNSRSVAQWCAMLMPLDYQAQSGFEPHVRECHSVWPLLPRPFEHDRGMCVYVWGPQRGGRFWPLRWKGA